MHKMKSTFMDFSAARLRIVSYLLFYLLSPLAAHATDVTYDKVEIFFIRWNIDTRTQLSPDDVRSRPYITTKITEPYEVASFVKWLGLNEMKDSGSARVEDARLVIDIYDKNGRRTTFYAGWFALLSEDGLKWKSIDSKFRNKFTFNQEARAGAIIAPKPSPEAKGS